MLKIVDGDTLPVHLNDSGSSLQVVSGSLNLQPNGYFVLAENDMVWTGHAFVQRTSTDGGTWTADGSLLTLGDTATERDDPYGAATSTYTGTIGPHVVSLIIMTNDGSTAHAYRYER